MYPHTEALKYRKTTIQYAESFLGTWVRSMYSAYMINELVFFHEILEKPIYYILIIDYKGRTLDLSF